MLRRLIKISHEIGAIGAMGSFAACLVLVIKGPAQPLVAYAAIRQAIAAISQWLLLPSLALVLVSGLLSIAATRAFHNAAWAWVKALLGVSLPYLFPTGRRAMTGAALGLLVSLGWLGIVLRIGHEANLSGRSAMPRSKAAQVKS